MQKVSEIIKDKKIVCVRQIERPVVSAERYWQAHDLSKKFGIGIKIMLRLLKKYPFSQIMGIYSWWADYPFKKKVNIGLLVWKLKELYPDQKLGIDKH